MAIEERMAKIEGGFEQLNKRMDELCLSLTKRMDRLEERMDRLGEKIDSNFKWTIGIILPMWVTIILAILLKG